MTCTAHHYSEAGIPNATLAWQLKWAKTVDPIFKSLADEKAHWQLKAWI